MPLQVFMLCGSRFSTDRDFHDDLSCGYLSRINLRGSKASYKCHLRSIVQAFEEGIFRMDDINKASLQSNMNSSDIAVIGMAGHFPQARNIEMFWNNLREGVESITTFTDYELELAGVDPAILRHPNYVKAGAIIADIDMFDAAFFGYSSREAEITDPQQRLFLECAWEALENAGYDPERFVGSIGVYAGTSVSSYLFNIFTNRELVETIGSLQVQIGNDKDFLTTRTAYKLNLKGPCYTIQTACSTSLVAIHVACQSLLNLECDMALAGGVSLAVPQKRGYLYQESSLYSPDGHCRAFDAEAKGVLFGNGMGVVVFKRLEDAVADGDTILAVIKGSAINNDGALKAGFTAPSVEGQAEVVVEAQAAAGVDPDTISYIEAHGTATAIGDPIEIAALNKAFRRSTNRCGFCAIGSVKTNIGHLDAAAGVAGFIKTVLALQHRQLPPSLHFKKANPHIDFANSPFYVNTSLSDWPSHGHPRRAGVSSFGIGGTNAHVILEEAPLSLPASASRPWQLLLLSARTPTALEKASERLCDHLSQHPEQSLADVAYTLQVGRKAFPYRRLLLCHERPQALQALQEAPNEGGVQGCAPPRSYPVAFLFPGQGSQYLQMGRELYHHEPSFRAEIDRCARLLLPLLGSDLRALLYPTQQEGGELTSDQEQRALLSQTWLTQPVLFAVEYGLAQLWLSWGVRPQAMVGHSLGEYVAACLAGVFSLEDALRLVVVRGRLMQQTAPGGMLVVMASEQEVQPRLSGLLAIAAVNDPGQCTVSGPWEELAGLEQQLQEQGVPCRRLQSSHAFHSVMMEPILETFGQHVAQTPMQRPTMRYLSNVTGSWIAAEQATDPQYWVRHLREPVRFGHNITTLLQEEPEWVLLEVGPGQTLSSVAKRQMGSEGRARAFTSLRQEGEGEQAHVLRTLGQLWLAGVKVDWAAFWEHEQRRRVPLPTYPFERQRFWIEVNKSIFDKHHDGRKRRGEERNGLKPDVAPSFVQRTPPSSSASSPRRVLEHQVADVWKKVLSLDHIGIDDDFFDLGGDSVIALQLLAQLSETFQTQLAPQSLLEARTVGAYCKLLEQIRESPDLQIRQSLPSPLVEIQPGYAKPPLFLMHAVGGSVYGYHEWARYLGSDQPVYGLQAVGLNGEAEPLDRVEQMAANYIAALRVIQPEGPYFLGGHSFGGTLAFAMAQELQRLGDDVALLGIFDTPGPEQMPQKFEDDAEILVYIWDSISSEVTISLDELRQFDTDNQLAYILKRAADVHLLPRNLGLPQAKHLLRVWKANLKAMWNYNPDVYQGRITFFRANEQRPRYDPPHPEYPWIDLAARGIEIYRVPGNHITMAQPPHLQTLIEYLKECLKRA